eukprot:m.129089 g.129089  ORF g.129089 m.129089 type:complete len:108 (-) comp16752_c0_seq3:97-420(-)
MDHLQSAQPSPARDRHDRVIAHFDLDFFYAQVEMLRNPALRGRPVGVVQKSLVVTANTEARQLGVPKMCSVSEAKRAGGNALHLVLGEDLTLVRTKQSAENKLNDSS